MPRALESEGVYYDVQLVDLYTDNYDYLGWGLSMGIPVKRTMGFKIAYIGTRIDQNTGSDTDTLSVGFSVMW